MKLELDGIKILIIVGIVLLLGGSNLFQFCNKQEVVREVVTVTKIDSSTSRKLESAKGRIITLETVVSTKDKDLLRVKAQLKALQEKHKPYPTVTFIDSPISQPDSSNKSYVAILDTLSGKDHIRAEYFHPYGVWNFYHNDYKEIQQISTDKTTREKNFIEFSHGIQAGVYYGVMNKMVDFGVGYGFQIRLNF